MDEHLTICVCGHDMENHQDSYGACASPECRDGGCDKFTPHFWEEIEETEKSAHQISMVGKEPTDKQIAYLRGLGHTGEVADRYEASQLIEKLKGDKSK